MKLRQIIVPLLTMLLGAVGGTAQVTRISIPAGTPEDLAIQEISKETDAQNREAALKAFVEKFSSNPAAVAYGYSQLSQHYQGAGDLKQALAYGDRAVQAMPNNLEVLVSQVNVAQQAKDWAKVVDYAARGGAAYNGIGKQPKPADTTDQQFANRVQTERASAQPAYEYLETAALNAIMGEEKPRERMALVEKFDTGFPETRYQEQIAQLAVYALQQLNDTARLAAYGQKALAANPDNLPLLSMLAAALAEDPKNTYLTRSVGYARKAIDLAKPNAPDADRSRKLLAGVAHSALGFALLKQEKTVAAVSELKAASNLLQEDPAAYSTVLYRLGFAYAKLQRYAEARQVLNKAVGIQGPFQQPSRELLSKVNAAR
ncbi:MAG TPA: tetratricopeptide repeat protein [Terriglobales bacterium]|nr:tetratricopeptide repeat protein [Terriglobales bacterium]